MKWICRLHRQREKSMCIKLQQSDKYANITPNPSANQITVESLNMWEFDRVSNLSMGLVSIPCHPSFIKIPEFLQKVLSENHQPIRSPQHYICVNLAEHWTNEGQSWVISIPDKLEHWEKMDSKKNIFFIKETIFIQNKYRKSSLYTPIGVCLDVWSYTVIMMVHAP